VVHGGTLTENKSVNLPDTQLSLSAVGPENREDVIREMTFASENEVDYIAASFVQSADDIVRMREILSEKGVDIPIIAKIENKAGVANLDEIIAAADGLMVARGDLGAEFAPPRSVADEQEQNVRVAFESFRRPQYRLQVVRASHVAGVRHHELSLQTPFPAQRIVPRHQRSYRATVRPVVDDGDLSRRNSTLFQVRSHPSSQGDIDARPPQSVVTQGTQQSRGYPAHNPDTKRARDFRAGDGPPDHGHRV